MEGDKEDKRGGVKWDRMKERRGKSNVGSVCNRYKRINVNIPNIGSMDIIFLEINWEAPLLQGADDNCSAVITNVNERMKLIRE